MPLDGAAAVCVDNMRIYSATPLSHGALVLVGSKHLFQFIDPVTSQVNRASFVLKCAAVLMGLIMFDRTQCEQLCYTVID